MQVPLSIARCVAAEAVEDHATPSNIRLGVAIADAGGVEIIDTGAHLVTAKVTGGQTRTATFRDDTGTLSWHCTCRRDQPPWCKHLVALAVTCARTGGHHR